MPSPSRFLLLAIAVLFIGGCSKSRTPCVLVAGQVLLDGKPVPEGFIRLIPTTGRVATGTLDAEGRFRLTTYVDGDGCIPGTHAVEVIAKKKLDSKRVQWLVPKKYFDVSTSGYTVKIDKAKEDLQIDLVSGGEKPEIETIDNRGDSVPGLVAPGQSAPE